MTEILLGKTNHLRIVKQVDFGYYLEGTIRGNRTEVLLPAGEVDDISQVVIAGQKAEIALQLTMQVRNRALSAYQELMRMQV